MNGAHDMGGVHGFGDVVPEPDEPVFHAEWERRAFALTIAMGATGEWNIDMSRAAREQRSPAAYLSMSYYQLWAAGLERLLAERGLVTAQEIEAGRAMAPGRPVKRLAAENVAAALSRGSPAERPATARARYGVGDRVRARNMHPHAHTRLPRYVRGHVGVVEHVHGCHVFADSHAAGEGENPQWLYAVRFTGRELWGADADPALAICIDAFESYLEPAGAESWRG